MFNVLFSYLTKILVPTRLRQLRMLSWMNLVVSYIKTIYDEYVVFRTEKLYLINFTGQTMYLQKYLQDEFEEGGIYISDGLMMLPVYLFNADESFIPVYIGNLFIDETVYSADESIVYLNTWYTYSDTGTGVTPDIDENATSEGEIEMMLVNESEVMSANDFIVWVPASKYDAMTNDDFNKMNAIVRYYKLVNKNYSIERYE